MKYSRNTLQGFSYNFRNLFVSNNIVMKKSKQQSMGQKEQEQVIIPSPISLDKSNNIIIKVLAKPGARHNNITDISSGRIGIQINAPPTEGEANIELIKYVSSILGLKKSNVVLDKGLSSRVKTLKILYSPLTIDQVKELFEKEISG